MKAPLAIIATLGALLTLALSDVHYAPSLTKAGIEAALAAASDGDVISLPAGEYEWTSAEGKLHVNKNVFLIGQGKGTDPAVDTILRHHWGPTSDSTMIQFNTNGTHGLSGIRFDDTAGSTDDPYNKGLILDYSSGDLLIWNCAFYGIDPDVIITKTYGVCWDCDFNNNRVGVIKNGDREGVGTAWGDGAWEAPIQMGTAKAFYIEDCTSYRPTTSDGFFTDGWEGARQVSRFNTLVGHGPGGTHGTESSQRYRSNRLIEVYHNTTEYSTSTKDTFVMVRGGTGMIFNNTYTGTSWVNSLAKVEMYRRNTDFQPFGIADGIALWDIPDLSDDGTGDDTTGAGDGIFATGTVTAIATDKITDSGAALSRSFAGYTVVQRASFTVSSFTSSSGGASTITVSPSPGWPNDIWNEWVIYVNNRRGKISDTYNGDTISLSTSYDRPPVEVGMPFDLTYAARVASNTSTEITVNRDMHYNSRDDWVIGVPFEIRRVAQGLDSAGMGMQTNSFGTDGTPMMIDTGQVRGADPVYHWGNRRNGSRFGSNGSTQVSTAGRGGTSNIDFFQEVPYSSFDGTSGVSIGTAAQFATFQATYTPTIPGVGFWVTDEGEWNSTNGAVPDGRLYQWNGSAWVLYYTPYTYPHPLRATVPGAPAPMTTKRIFFDGTGRPLKFGLGRPLKYQ